MPASRRLRILQAMQTLAETITVANGFNTNLGEHVLFAELPKFGSDDPRNFLALMPGEDEPQEQQIGKIRIHLPVHALIVVGPDEPDQGLYREQAIADVKTAFERSPGNAALLALLMPGFNKPAGFARGTTETYDKMAGSEFYGALISYMACYDESIGYPEA